MSMAVTLKLLRVGDTETRSLAGRHDQNDPSILYLLAVCDANARLLL